MANPTTSMAFEAVSRFSDEHHPASGISFNGVSGFRVV